MLVGTDDCLRVSLRVGGNRSKPGENQPARLGDHMTISHADAGY